MRLLALIALSLTWSAGALPAAGQTGTIDSLLAANRHEIGMTSGRLSGAGASWLIDALADAQFVVLGESHNEAEIPAFTAALYAALRERYGFRYLALENGPTAVEGIGAAAATGGLDSAEVWAGRYRNALQFWNDGEVAAIARVVASEGRDGVWGLDQEWGALHITDRLRSLARTDRARSVATEVHERVAEIESQRTENGRARYISSGPAIADAEALREAFQPASGSEADVLITRMALSSRIYGLRTGRVGYFDSNALRERSMKLEFMRRYRAAMAAGDSLPRVVVKFGHVHSVDGRNQSDVLALGSFLSQFALTNERQSFQIAIYGLNEAGRHWTLSEYEDYAPVTRASRIDAWTLLDLRPLRPWVSAGRLENLNNTLRDVILGFDAVLVIGGLSPASRARITTR